MSYEFCFYKDEDFDEIEQLVLASYQWQSSGMMKVCHIVNWSH